LKKGEMMSGKKKKVNPTAFIAIGICYIGAGVALSAALETDSGPVIGIAITGIGIIFLVIGIVNRKKE
jgi:hypothetical protein